MRIGTSVNYLYHARSRTTSIRRPVYSVWLFLESQLSVATPVSNPFLLLLLKLSVLTVHTVCRVCFHHADFSDMLVEGVRKHFRP